MTDIRLKIFKEVFKGEEMVHMGTITNISREDAIRIKDEMVAKGHVVESSLDIGISE